MSVIVPGGTILICNNVPLIDNYLDTLWFDDKQQQYAYFVSKVKYKLENYTYMRVNEALRVEIPSENLYDCNYLVFRNDTFGTKYFYAFITGVTYINNETSEIKYELDVIQTWHFDYELRQCFVERQHSLTDAPGDNLIPEQLETGEFVFEKQAPAYATDLDVMIATTFHISAESVSKDGTLRPTFGQVQSCLEYTILKQNRVVTVLSEIDKAGLADGVVSIFLFPRAFASTSADYEFHPQNKITYVTSKYSRPEKIGTYVPKNKKLLTAPYVDLMLDNLNGNSAAYCYEYANNGEIEIKQVCIPSCNPELVAYPTSYKGVLENFQEKICMQGFSQVAYSSDVYKVWLAQNSSSLSTNAISSVFSIVAGAMLFAASKGSAAPAAYGMVSGGIAGVASSLAEISDKRKLPPQASGASGGDTIAAVGELYIHIYKRRIREEYAKIIDEYFNAYGYKMNRVVVPNRTARPCWTYVKTQGCLALGSVPADDMRKICSVYDNGVRWWKRPEYYGNYDLDNSPE